MSERERVRSGAEWAVVAALTLVGVGIGVGSRTLVVAATLPLWYVVAGVIETSTDATVDLERRLAVVDGESDDADSISATEPVRGEPGATVVVRTTVRNAGAEPIVDLRVVDGVPDALPVVSGSPRACFTLEPGAERTVEYAVELRRGDHAFEDATVRTRGLAGTAVETRTAPVTGDDALRCSSAVESVPLDGGTNDYAGEVPTDEGGSGVEFYAVREYEAGDPVGAIDWRRYAGTRELATVEYRAERATRIVCVVDGRGEQFRAATTDRRPAIDLSATAAERTARALADAGHPVGVVGFDGRRLASVSPGSDPGTRRAVTDLLEATRSGTLRDRGNWTRGDSVAFLPRRLPGEAQVYLFSAFTDDEPVDLVERLRARGYAVRVVAPDVTAGVDDVPTRLEALERDDRLARARTTGARVVDWSPERPLRSVLREATAEVRSR